MNHESAMIVSCIQRVGDCVTVTLKARDGETRQFFYGENAEERAQIWIAAFNARGKD